ncbi:MAG: sigma-54 dependent transcriptional regulator [Lysobacteraceae bacterium]|nr:sigma-54 dependent transcriptional regulator [Xanthomonadaceae bacterium]HRX98765.1 sigma-54 dependent transcriptional regulator [Xanthomonadaceae bacterium]
MPAISHAHILIVDDEPDIRGLLRDVLEDEGYRVSDAPDAEAARLLVAQQAPDAVLLDIWMPGEDGLSLLRGWAEAGRRRGGLAFPVVMMSGHGTVDTAVEATKLGAYDFIEKPITLAKLLITLQRALEASRLRADNAALRRQAQPVRPAGDSTPMQALREKLERLAGHDSAVLLRGEPGTEKEALARWLHSLGPRRDQPFIAVVPGAIASGQAAATLFGAEDASGVRPGLLEQAQGGTLFLDEVAELDAELQQRLSSVIERGQLLRVGGQQPVDLNVRVVAATAQDLEAARAQGRFRDELYFQLNVVPLEVPPLRERRADLAELLAQYAAHFARRDGLSPRRFGAAAQSRLQRHDWPGNLRELRNLVQRLTLLGSDEVTVPEVDAMLDGRAVAPVVAAEDAMAIDFSLPLREAREQFERLYLSRRLDEAGGSVGKLAKMTGMERTHLYRKLRDLGVENRSGGRDD